MNYRNIKFKILITIINLIFVFPQNSYVKALGPSVAVVGEGTPKEAIKVVCGLKDEALI